MRKGHNYIISDTRKTSLNKNVEADKIKTTNVNILLNRVRLDQKRTLKKRPAWDKAPRMTLNTHGGPGSTLVV